MTKQFPNQMTLVGIEEFIALNDTKDRQLKVINGPCSRVQVECRASLEVSRKRRPPRNPDIGGSQIFFF